MVTIFFSFFTEHCGQESFCDLVSKQSTKEKHPKFFIQFLGEQTFRTLNTFSFSSAFWPNEHNCQLPNEQAEYQESSVGFLAGKQNKPFRGTLGSALEKTNKKNFRNCDIYFKLCSISQFVQYHYSFF